MEHGKKTLSRSDFTKLVRDTVKQYGMLTGKEKVLVAVSGGADSVCLLRVLLDIKRSLGLSIVVGNLDHGLRGRESEKDSAFVESLCREWKVPFRHSRVKVRSSGRKGTSTEEKAREARYAFLMRAAEDNGCSVIATGHTMDDQAETVLMKVLQGASSSGMSGIPPVRYEGDIKVIRPLIRVTRSDVLAFIRSAGAVYVEDKSNRDTRFLRNRVRLEILPFLEKYNPRIRRALSNIADNLREDMVFAEGVKNGVYEGCLRAGSNGPVPVKISDILLQPAYIRKAVFREAFARAGGNIKKLTYRHWMDADLFIRMSAKGASLDLPGGVRVERTRDELKFLPAGKRGGKGCGE